MANLLRALRFYRAEGPRLALVVGLMMAGIAAGLLRPWPLAWLVNFLITREPTPGLGTAWLQGASTPSVIALMACLTLGLHLLHAGLSAWLNYVSIGMSLRGLARVRCELFARLQRLSWGFHQRMPPGDLVYRATWDACAVQTLFQQGVVTLATGGLTLALMVVIMVRLSPGLTGVALLTAPALLGVIRWIGPWMSSRGGDAQRADSALSARVQQSIQALPLLQGYTREGREEGVFSRLAEEARRARLSHHGVELLYGAAVAGVFAAGAAATLWIGGGRVASGALSVGGLLVFLAYLAQLYEPLNQLSHMGATLATAGASAARVFEILDEPCELETEPNNPAPFPILTAGGASAGIRFREVTFAYRPGEPVLRRVDFEVPVGEVVAIVGRSGAGKSTLLSLVPRFQEPQEGGVEIGGINVRGFSRPELRRQISIVFQEPLLWPGTVAENIAFGRPEASQEEIMAAARAAHADGFIGRLPQGYGTVIGDGAARLSVGEKQRLGLARAFLKDAPILLLDEPTSALDEESERLVIDSLERLVRGRTVFMVAHRTATLRLATRRLELEEGKITAFGASAGRPTP